MAISDLRDDIADIFDPEELAEAITFDGRTIYAIPTGYGIRLENYPEAEIADAVIVVQAADVESPEVGTAVRLGRVDYVVSDILEGNGLTWSLALARKVA